MDASFSGRPEPKVEITQPIGNSYLVVRPGMQRRSPSIEISGF